MDDIAAINYNFHLVNFNRNNKVQFSVEYGETSFKKHIFQCKKTQNID